MSIKKKKINKSHSLPLAEPLLIKFFGNIKILEYQNGNVYRKMDSDSSIKLKVLEGTLIKTLDDDSIAVIYEDENFTLNSKRRCLKCNKEIDLTEYEKALEIEEDDLFEYKLTEIKENWLKPETEIFCSSCNIKINEELSKQINNNLKIIRIKRHNIIENLMNLIDLCNNRFLIDTKSCNE